MTLENVQLQCHKNKKGCLKSIKTALSTDRSKFFTLADYIFFIEKF